MPAIPLYTLSEQPNVMNGPIIITLSNQFVTDLNNDVLREQTLDKLHRHINSVSQFLHRMCIIQYPSGVFTNDKGHKIDTPTIISLIPLCTVSKEEDESVNMVISDHIIQDQEKSKLDKLHAFRIAIKAQLSGQDRVSELQQYEERQKGEKQKALLAQNKAKKKQISALRKDGLIAILIGFSILAIAGAGIVLTFLFPVVGLTGIGILPGIVALAGLALFLVGVGMVLKSYGFDFTKSLNDLFADREIPLDKNHYPEIKPVSKKTPSQVLPHRIYADNPVESNTIVKSSDAPENVAASSKAPKTGHKT